MTDVPGPIEQAAPEVALGEAILATSEPTTLESQSGAGTPVESAPENRRVLEDLLREEATGFQFFQAVRLLERLRPDKGKVGEFTDPAEEVAHFKVRPSLAFPAAEVHSIDLPTDPEERTEMVANFMGLVGPLGVMPLEYTQLVAAEASSGNKALADFLNIFEHRMISLFYRAWKKNRFTVNYEEQAGSDALTQHLFDFVGLGLDSFRGHLPFDDRTLLYYANLLQSQRGAVALEHVVQDYFGVDATVEQFVGQWHTLRDDDLCEVSEEPSPSNALGSGALVGDEVWDLHARVRIRIGPLDRESYENFLPGNPGHLELQALTRFFGQGQYAFEAQLVLKHDRVPPLVLGGEDRSHLGWSTWVRSAPFEHDADETVLVL